jgi:hypothetical protein
VKLRAAILYSVGSVRDPDHEAADALRQQSSETADPFSVWHRAMRLLGRLGSMLAFFRNYMREEGQRFRVSYRFPQHETVR